MAKRTIEWTDEALDSFELIAQYILQQWNYKTDKDFDEDVTKLLTRLETNSKLCPQSQI